MKECATRRNVVHCVYDAQTGELLAFGQRKKELGGMTSFGKVRDGLRKADMYLRHAVICGRDCFIHYVAVREMDLKGVRSMVTQAGRRYGLRAQRTCAPAPEKRERRGWFKKFLHDVGMVFFAFLLGMLAVAAIFFLNEFLFPSRMFDWIGGVS